MKGAHSGKGSRTHTGLRAVGDRGQRPGSPMGRREEQRRGEAQRHGLHRPPRPGRDSRRVCPQIDLATPTRNKSASIAPVGEASSIQHGPPPALTVALPHLTCHWVSSALVKAAAAICSSFVFCGCCFLRLQQSS